MSTMDFIDEERNNGNKINLFQFLLLGACFISVDSFSKLPLDLYLGKSWSLLIYLVFFLVLAPLVLYIQFRLSAKFPRGLLCYLEKYSPWSLVFSIATIVSNFFLIILNSVSITYSMSYTFLTFFPCDMKYCVGTMYMWSSCQDSWSIGDCKSGELKIYSGPTPEDKFFINFILGRSIVPHSFSGFASWFDINGLVLLPYFLGWFTVVLLVIGGPRYFTSILYILAPLSTASLLSCCVYIGVEYASEAEQGIVEFMRKFYRNFLSRRYISTYEWDRFQYKPLFWGLVSTLVNLTTVTRLFNGVYPVISTWLPKGKKKRHLAWFPILLLSGLINNLPILIIFFSAASAFEEDTLRCHMASNWITPFSVLTHVFSRFSTRKVIAASFFIGLTLNYLLSQALLLMCTVENVVLHLGKWSQRIDDQLSKTYKIFLYLLTIIFSLCGLMLITTSGFYWYRIIDWYKDRLFSITIFAQCLAVLILYLKSRASRFESVLVKSIYSFFFGVTMLIFVISWMWYGFYANEKSPDSSCRSFVVPEKDPLENDHYKSIGWFIASLPLLIGVVFGLFINSKNAQLSETNFCSYLLFGEVAIEKANRDYIYPQNSGNDYQKSPFLQNDNYSHTNPFYGTNSSTMMPPRSSQYIENRYISPAIVHDNPYDRSSFMQHQEDPYAGHNNYSLTMQPNLVPYVSTHNQPNSRNQLFDPYEYHSNNHGTVYRANNSNFI